MRNVFFQDKKTFQKKKFHKSTINLLSAVGERTVRSSRWGTKALDALIPEPFWERQAGNLELL